MRIGEDPGGRTSAALETPKPLHLQRFWLDGAAPESNRASVGLPRLTGFEDPLGHRPPPLQAVDRTPRLRSKRALVTIAARTHANEPRRPGRRARGARGVSARG